MNAASPLSLPQTPTPKANVAAGLSRLTAQATGDTAKIDKVSKDFEAVFIAQMMEPMFGESLGDQAFGDKESADVYKGMMSEQYGKIIAQAGGIGIADVVRRELLKQQEQTNGTASTSSN